MSVLHSAGNPNYKSPSVSKMPKLHLLFKKGRVLNFVIKRALPRNDSINEIGKMVQGLGQATG